MRYIFIFLVFGLIKTACAQLEAVDTMRRIYHRPVLLDSAQLAQLAIEQQHSDSVARFYITPPDSARANKFLDSVIKARLYTGYAFLDIHTSPVKNKVQPGKSRPVKEAWLLGVLLVLLLYIGLLNRFSSKSITDIIESVFNKRQFSQFSKDDNLISSWSFLMLFILFGATMGLLLYELVIYFNRQDMDADWQLYAGFSLAVLIFFILKMLVLRILGWLFNVSNLVSEYVSVLYLTYFNVTFVTLPLVICLALIADIYKPAVLLFFGMLILIVLFWQYIRSSINILSVYRFSKVYLFIYLCALEFCPLLILIKALKL